jgi:hypothetical protein
MSISSIVAMKDERIGSREGTDDYRTSSSHPQQKRSREYLPSRLTFQGMRKGDTRRIHGMHSIG